MEALALSIGERGKVDMAYMSQLCGLSEEEIYRELKGVIFLNPMYGYGGGREEKYLPERQMCLPRHAALLLFLIGALIILNHSTHTLTVVHLEY